MNEAESPRQHEEERKLKGLYKDVKVSVRTLDIIILCCIAFIVLLLIFDLQSPGFTVSFDSRGGTDVPAQTRQYGQLLEPPLPPGREGYSFTGWYTDSACFEQWKLEEDTVEGSLTLYAGWEKEEQ